MRPGNDHKLILASRALKRAAGAVEKGNRHPFVCRFHQKAARAEIELARELIDAVLAQEGGE